MKRYFAAIGVSRYDRLDDAFQLPSVGDDVRTMTALFTQELGYTAVLGDLVDPSSDELRQGLHRWLTVDAPTDDHALVVYFSGHGCSVDGRHYLMTRDTTVGRVASTALPTEDLPYLFGPGSRPRDLLLIIDTCVAGQAADDLSTGFARLATAAWKNTPAAGWSVIAASRRETARPAAFSAAFVDAVRSPELGTEMPYVPLDHLVEQINARLARGKHEQRALTAGGETGAAVRMIPNLAHRRGILNRVRQFARQDFDQHWLPRARGCTGHVEDDDWYFSGRDRVLDRLVSWINEPGGDHRARIVTGAPGVGKSAVLAQIVMMSDIRRRAAAIAGRRNGPVLTLAAVTVAVYARNRSTAEILAALCDGLGVPLMEPRDLVAALREQRCDRVAVIDALDEADDPAGVVDTVIRPLLHGAAAIQLKTLLGLRRPTADRLGSLCHVFDLDSGEYGEPADLVRYVGRLLARRPTAEPVAEPEDVSLAKAIAERADGNFLIARLVSESVAYQRARGDAVDPRSPPATVGEAFDGYLEGFGSGEQRVRDFLSALAWAEGEGLPSDSLWLPVTRALSGNPDYGPEDLDAVRDTAGAYLAHSQEVYPTTGGGGRDESVCRLYHQALAEHLRGSGRPEVAQSQVVDALVGTVPPDPAHPALRWDRAHPYVCTYLPTHAAAGGRLSVFVQDPGFLLAADPDRLLMCLQQLKTDAAARAAAGAYQRAVHHIRNSRESAAAYLQLAAHQCSVPLLQRWTSGPNPPWSTSWARWHDAGAHRVALAHGPVRTLRLIAGTTIAAAGYADGRLAMWDVGLATPRGQALLAHRTLTDLTIVDLSDGLAVVTAGADGTLRCWNPFAGTPIGHPIPVCAGPVTAVEAGRNDGVAWVLVGDTDGVVRRFTVPHGEAVGRPMVPPSRWWPHRKRTLPVRAIAATSLDGVQLAVVATADDRVRWWSVQNGEQVGAIERGVLGPVEALAVADLGGQPCVFTAGRDGVVQGWDLRTARRVGNPVPGHRRGVGALAAVSVDDRICVVLGGWDGRIRIWCHEQDGIVEPLVGHNQSITTVDVDCSDPRMRVIVSGGEDGTIRIWDWPQASGGGATGPRPAAVRALAVANIIDRPAVVSGADDGTLNVSDLRTGTSSIPAPPKHHLSVTAIATTSAPEGSWIGVAGSRDDALQFWTVDNGVRRRLIANAHTAGVWCLAVATVRDRRLIVSGGGDGSIRIWDPVTADQLGDPVPMAGRTVRSVVAVPDGNGAIVLTLDDLGALRRIRLTGYPLHAGPVEVLADVCEATVRVLAVDSDASAATVYGGTADGTVLRWEATATKPTVTTLHRHTKAVNALTVSRTAGATVVASGGDDCSVIFHAVDTSHRQKVEMGSAVVGLQLVPGTHDLAVACESGVAVLTFPLTPSAT